jgi:Tol biopolymer transport system component
MTTENAARRIAAVGLLTGVLALLAVPASAAAGTTERVSVDSAGNQENGYPRPWTTHLDLALSADGRFVAFTSRSTNLVPGDTNGSPDVFVHDRQTGTTERVSVDSAGTEGNGQSLRPTLSADGRFVAFISWATNLVPEDTNGAADVFVRDRQTGITERVSVASDGMQGNREAWFLGPPALSADGRFVAFISEASNLVPGDTNGTPDVFVHDRQTGTTERVSVDSAGNQLNTYFYYPSLSADGRFVAFARFRPLGYTMGSREDVYVHDRQTGTTELVGMNSAGGATLSPDGRFVFGMWANADFGVPLAPVVYDRQTGTTERVNVDGHHSAISLDFRFVAFISYCGTIYYSECAPVPGDTNSASDVFVHDRQTGTTERVSVASDGTQGDSGSYSPAISADGRIVAFISDATNLVPGDTNGVDDIFVHDRGAPSAEGRDQ